MEKQNWQWVPTLLTQGNTIQMGVEVACLKLILRIVKCTKARIGRDIFISTNVCHPAFVADRPVDSLPADVRQENQYLQFLYIVFRLFVFPPPLFL